MSSRWSSFADHPDAKEIKISADWGIEQIHGRQLFLQINQVMVSIIVISKNKRNKSRLKSHYCPIVCFK
jgi:hypothetical protein